MQVSAADPLNLVGILLPGERVAAIPGRQIHLRNGNLNGAESASDAIVEAISAVVPAAAFSVGGGRSAMSESLRADSPIEPTTEPACDEA